MNKRLKKLSVQEQNLLELSKFNTWSRKKELKESFISLGLAGLYGANKIRKYLIKRSEMNKAFQDTADAYANAHPSNPVPTGVAYNAFLQKARQEGEARTRERLIAPRDEFLGKVMDALRPPTATLKANKRGKLIGGLPLRFGDIEGLHPHELGKPRGGLRKKVKDFVRTRLDPHHPTLSKYARMIGPVVADVVYNLASQAKTSYGSRPNKNPVTGKPLDPYVYSPGISPSSRFADKIADRNARRVKMGLKPLKYPE